MQFSWINPKAAAKKSGISGIGLFAQKNIKRNEVILVQGGRVCSAKQIYQRERDLIHVCYLIEKNLLICPILKSGRIYKDGAFLMNHSCNPNCGIKGQITFVALRNIRRGEELTYDYAMTDSFVAAPGYKSMKMTCNCLSKSCRKFVTDTDWMNPSVIQKYNGFFSKYIEAMILENRLGHKTENN